MARVFNHRITGSQLERALRERLWLEGKTPEALTPEARKLARIAPPSTISSTTNSCA